MTLNEKVARRLGYSIGPVRRFLFVPWDSKWNAFVRDITARIEAFLALPEGKDK